ncbi:MAG: TonB-dependent receptor [Terriglobia bacterium]
MSPTALGLLSYIPLPNLPGSVLNYHQLLSLPTNSDMILSRFNFRISPNDNLAVAYFWRQTHSETTQVFPGFLTTQSTRGQNARLNYVHNFTSHLINNATYSFNRMRTSSLNEFAYVNDVAGDLGISGVPTDPINYGVPTVRLTNYAALQDTYPLLRRDQTSHLGDTLTWVKNKHTFRGGIEYRRVEINSETEPNSRGTFVFNGSLTSALDSTGAIIRGTGYDLADFLLGLPQSTSIRYGTSSNYFRGNVYNTFIQDNWKLTPQLTINVGLRYEFVTPLIEKYNHIANLDVAPEFTGVSVVVPNSTGPYSGPFPRGLINPDRNNFAPRLGIAWKPFQHHSTVIRSGYGIFYNSSIYNQIDLQLASQPPFAFSNTLITGSPDVLTLNNGFPPPNSGTVTNNYAVDRSLRVGYIQLWNLDIQHQLRPNLVLTLSYNGSKGTGLDVLLSPNRLLVTPQTPSLNPGISNAQEFFFESYGANSSFNSFSIRLQRRFTSGLAVNGSYIYGKSLDDASSIGGSQQTVALYTNNLEAERGLSTFDIRHQANISSVYELPMGERKKFLSQGGWPTKVAGGWSLMAIIALQSGTPYTARISGSSTFLAGIPVNQSLRADATGEPISLPSSEQSVEHFFNTAAFAIPGTGILGNAGRNTITGPGMANVNMTVTKAIPLSNDGKRLEFRAQANNLFNTVNFSGLGVVADSSTFGQLTSARQMRQITFTIRFSF